MLKKINSLFVTMFGIGKLPRIPGSYASLVTVIFLYLLFHIFSVPADASLVVIVKNMGLYLEEDTSIGVTASAANDLACTITYEELS